MADVTTHKGRTFNKSLLTSAAADATTIESRGGAERYFELE